MAMDEPHVIDQYELERQNDVKTIITTLYPKVLLGGISLFSILADLNKIFGIIKIIADHTDWILVNIPVVLFIVVCVTLRSAKFDPWVIGVARTSIGSTFMKVGVRNITLNFEIKSTRKDIQKFVQEITDKSELYNYFLVKASYKDPCRVTIRSRARQVIPEKASFDKDINTLENWNYIPLGIGLNKEGRLGIVSWMMNKEEKCISNDNYGVVETIPSNSFLIAGGTGSGKSVLENNIIRHINKYNTKIMSTLIDVKRVEFGNLSNLKGVSAVAIDIKEAASVLDSTQKIMMSRFKQMESLGVNDVYDIKDFICDWYTFDAGNGGEVSVQFDEILYCTINDEVVIDIAQNIVDKIKSGDEVRIYFDGQKTAPVIANPTTENYVYLGDQVYTPDAKIKLRGGKEMTALEIFKGVQNGQVYETAL